jgi:hypothetical protein
VLLGGFGCFWVGLGAFGWARVLLGEFGCIWVGLGIGDLPSEPNKSMYVHEAASSVSQSLLNSADCSFE